MSLDLTSVGGPVWLSRSRVSAESRDHGTFQASSMQGVLERIVDGDPFSRWNSADDLSTETIEVSFQLRESKTSYAIDFIALQNFNGLRWKMEYKAGAGSYATIPETDYSGSDWDGDDFASEISEITADMLKLTITSSQAGSTSKHLGGFYACSQTLQLSQGGFRTYDRNYRDRTRRIELGDGGVSLERIKRSAISHEHWGLKGVITLASQTERDTLRQIKREGDPFSFMPEPFNDQREIYTCEWFSQWRDSYVSKYSGGGYNIPFDIRETGEL